MILFFEIGPLKEREFTGIAQVTAAIAEQIIGDQDMQSEFFYGRMIVPKSVVEGLLEARNGELLEWYLRRIKPQPAPNSVAPSVGVFPNRKTARRAFSKECQIIHDLSTLLAPQFHNQDTIAFHATTMEQDILTNDVTFCVSEATRSDVLAYFPHVAPESIQTLPLAAALASDAHTGWRSFRLTEQYVLVLGTIEPRKNVAQVLRYIRANPEFLERYRVVFLGRFGWGKDIDELIRDYQLYQQYNRGRLLFPGFVTEEIKSILIGNAQILIYPSLFEGFGLPVLEAAALGVPCVTTKSSSLPEAGGPSSYYFDPFATGDFDAVFETALHHAGSNRSAIRDKCQKWASAFSWKRTYDVLKSRIFAACVE